MVSLPPRVYPVSKQRSWAFVFHISHWLKNVVMWGRGSLKTWSVSSYQQSVQKVEVGF